MEALGITEEIIYKSAKNNIYKKILIYALCRYADAKQRTIGELFSFHYSTISRTAKEIFAIAMIDIDLASKVKLIDRAIYCGGARSCISNNLDWRNQLGKSVLLNEYSLNNANSNLKT